MHDYALLFEKIEASLKKNLFVGEQEYERRLERFCHMDFRTMSDKDVFWVLVQVVFHAGVRSATIERRKTEMKEWLYDFKLLAEASDVEEKQIVDRIGFRNKVRQCILNAKSFSALVLSSGSFQQYFRRFGIDDLNPPERNLDSIRKDLCSRFVGLGPINVNHFLSDLGLYVLKPDRVICRIFFRLGLIKGPDDTDGAIATGRNFQRVIGKPLRVIDIIMVKYGQVEKSEDLGTNGGICLENNPKCHLCDVRDYCRWYRNRSGMV